MCCNIDFKNTATLAGIMAATSTITAGVAQLAGHSIGLLNGAGFGLVQGVITYVASNHMPKCLPDIFRSSPVAMVAGGLAAFGASHAVAALGFIAAPISVPAAIVLTVTNIALPYLCVLAVKSCCAKTNENTNNNKNALDEETQKKAAASITAEVLHL